VSHEVITDLIGTTTTLAGLTVQAVHGMGTYPTKIKVSGKESIEAHSALRAFHGAWSYAIGPAAMAA